MNNTDMVPARISHGAETPIKHTTTKTAELCPSRLEALSSQRWDNLSITKVMPVTERYQIFQNQYIYKTLKITHKIYVEGTMEPSQFQKC